jgi:hypothetical protein
MDSLACVFGVARLLPLIGSCYDIRSEARMLWSGGRSELEKLKEKLNKIQVYREDAENKHLLNDAVGLWLKKLKQVQYDIEDIDAEYQLREGLPRQRHYAFIIKEIPFGHAMGVKIREVNERLQEMPAPRELQLTLSKALELGHDPHVTGVTRYELKIDVIPSNSLVVRYCSLANCINEMYVHQLFSKTTVGSINQYI